MVFSSTTFLLAFLPLVGILYFICPRKLRNALLLVFSLLFYGWGEPKYILIMLFSTVFDYCNGLAIGHFRAAGKPKGAKAVLVVSVVGNLSILGFFKYTDFAITNLNGLLGTAIPALGLLLPIGISFYTFQTMSYTIDVYRGLVPPQRNIIDFSAYVTLFPQLIAGPIVQYKTVAADLENRNRESLAGASAGMQRFVIGLGKKVLLANQMGAVWEEIAAMSAPSVVTAWLGALAFTFQIYFDFSGYSDMAIGLGRLFGFRFLENFNYPYESRTVTEFWRRWHISLSTWFREYVYIPLGGNRKGLGRQLLNIAIVWFLTGLWHGASWNFVLWGLYFFVLLCIERLLKKQLSKIPKPVRHVLTLLLILISYVLKPGVSTIIFALSLTGWLGMARFIRNQIIIIRDRDYNLASRCLGISTGRIIVKNLLPYMVSVITMRMALAIPSAIGNEVFVTYIGIGLPVDTPSLGNLIQTGRSLMTVASLRYQLFFPVAVLVVITVSFYIIGNAFADAADPKNHVR